MGWPKSLLGRIARRGRGDAILPLYHAVVERARRSHWYEGGGVPDTVDGRFDMIAAILSLVLLRLEGAADAAGPSARLTERFVSDMDQQLREMGIGDIGVGKHIGKMMGMLGGRLGAYRDGLAPGAAADAFDAALVRNLYRGEAPDPVALAHTQAALVAFRDTLAAAPDGAILTGTLP